MWRIPNVIFFGSAKKAGLLEAKKWVNIVTREDIDHLIFVLQYLFVSTVSWVLGATLKKVSVSLDPQNDGTFTKKIWHNQSTKNFGLDIFPYFSYPQKWPPKRSNTQRGFQGISSASRSIPAVLDFSAKSGGAPRYQFPNGQQTHVYIQYIYICIYIYNITYI